MASEVATAARVTLASGTARVWHRIFFDPPVPRLRKFVTTQEGVTDFARRRTQTEPEGPGELDEWGARLLARFPWLDDEGKNDERERSRPLVVYTDTTSFLRVGDRWTIGGDGKHRPRARSVTDPLWIVDVLARGSAGRCALKTCGNREVRALLELARSFRCACEQPRERFCDSLSSRHKQQCRRAAASDRQERKQQPAYSLVPVDYIEWLRWWRRRGRVALEDILLARWDPLGIRDDPEQRETYARWAVRIGIRLRHGVSAEEIFELLASANRQLGVRVNTRQLAAAAMEIRRWYRREQDDPPRRYWPVIYTEPER